MLNKNQTSNKDFWTVNEDSKGRKTINIEKDKLLDFISATLGFYLLKDSYGIIRVTDSCVMEQARVEDIKQAVKHYLLKVAKEPQVWSAFLNAYSITNDSMHYLNTLQSSKSNISTKEEAFLFFKNGVVSISEEKSICLTSYEEFKGYVWRDQIVNRNFTPVADKGETAEFARFVKNIAGSAEKENYLKSLIGYLLHSYKDRANSKAVILIDEKTDFTGKAYGGTGKSIVATAIRQMTPVAWKDGRNFNEKETFAFDNVKPETRVLYFDDAHKSMSLEPFYSLITGDMTVNRKYKDSQTIPFALTPKLLISTNYLVKGAGGNTDERRRLEFEVAPYYSKARTPADEFGHNFFDDWDEEEWTLFDNFMLDCVLHYLTCGIAPVTSADMGRKKVILATSEEFVEFAEEEISLEEIINKTDLYPKFRDQSSQNRAISAKGFKNWLDEWADYKGYDLCHKKSNGKAITIPIKRENEKD